MSEYKSQKAWDDTHQQSPAPGPAEGPSPLAEGKSEEYELGNLAVTDHARPVAPPSAAPSRVPWLLLVLVVAGVAAFIVLRHLPLMRVLEDRERELALAADANAKLTGRVDQLERHRAELESSQADLQLAVQLKEQALAELTRAQNELAAKLEAEISKGDVLINQRGGELVVDLVDQILFDSGEAALNDQGKGVLKKVGETFASMPEKIIQVGGHTDNVPISPKLEKSFPSNWELSTARATNVVRFLQDECKIPGERLAAAGFSQYRPSANNATKAGRRKNRRIEVVLLAIPAHLKAGQGVNTEKTPEKVPPKSPK